MRNLSLISGEVIQASIAIHRDLGPGLLESAYQRCLKVELTHRGLNFIRQKPLGLVFQGHHIPAVYRLDFVVEEQLILEVKSVARWEPIFDAQLLTYLRLTGLTVGLLLNFNVPRMRDGVKRLVLGYREEPPSAPLR